MKRYYALLVSFVLFLCLPFLSLEYAPLVDYPNHLASIHALSHLRDSAVLQQRYEVVLAPVPNLGMELVMWPLLLAGMDVMVASKVFLCFVVVVFVSGGHRLACSLHGGPSYAALLCAFAVYNSMLLYGFVNYVLGVGLFLHSLSCWINWRTRWSWLRLAAMSLLALACYLTHLTAFGFLAISVAIFTMWEMIRTRSLRSSMIVGCVPLAIALLPAVAFMGGGGKSRAILWNTVPAKLIGLLSPVLTYSTRLDVVLIAGFGILMLGAILLSRKREFWTPATAAALVFLLMLAALPLQFFDNAGSGMDTRFALPAILLLLLGVQLEVPQRWGTILLTGALALCVVRIGHVWMTWIGMQPAIAEQVRAFSQVKTGARLYPAFLLAGGREEQKRTRALEHIPHYATLMRDAMVPTLFAEPASQILLFRQKPEYVSASQAGRPDWEQTWSSYDYLWTYDPAGEIPMEPVMEGSQKVAAGEWWALWRVTPSRKDDEDKQLDSADSMPQGGGVLHR